MSARTLRDAMLEDFSRSGLDESDAKLLQISCTTHTLKPAGQAYTIPYFDSKGKKTKFYRIRYISSVTKGFAALTGEKPRRYNQPYNTVNEIYLPPYIDWTEQFKDSRLPIVVTEGEKKAAAACKAGIATIGLGGVWCFMSKRSGETLLSVFNEIDLKGRPVIICYDSDAYSNPDIVYAESVLARRFVERGAVVQIARIPHNGHKRGIDDYIVEKGVASYRRNVLAKAYHYSESRVLHSMNEELVYIRSVGSIYDYAHEQFNSPSEFVQHSHSNIYIDERIPATETNRERVVKKPAAKMWLGWEHRAELKSITYAPGQPPITDNNEFNTWPGWGVKDAVKGNVAPWKKLLDHLFEGAEPEARVWFEQWCAYPIQNPGCKMATGAVIWGVMEGTGKTLCGHTLMRLYGKNATEVKDADLQSTRFAWATNKQFVLADDITGHDNRKLSNMFKTMITQKTIHVDEKWVKNYIIPDTINYYFTSNDPDAFKLSDNDRRFFIHEVTSGRLPVALRKEYMEWLESEGGVSALFYYLLNLDVGTFDPQAEAFQTEAKNEMARIGKSEMGAWVGKLRETPDTVLNGRMRGDLFTAEELYNLYDPIGDKRASPNALAREMKRSGIIKLQSPKGGGIVIPEKGQVRLYAVRNADKWRKETRKNIVEHYMETHRSKLK